MKVPKNLPFPDLIVASVSTTHLYQAASGTRPSIFIFQQMGGMIMTALRQRMVEDMQLRNLSEHTPVVYVSAKVHNFRSQRSIVHVRCCTSVAAKARKRHQQNASICT